MNDKKIKLATNWIAGMDFMEAQKFDRYLNMFAENEKSLRSLRRPEHWDEVRENLYKYVVFGDGRGITRDAKTWRVDKVLEAMNNPTERATAQALREHWSNKKGIGIGD